MTTSQSIVDAFSSCKCKCEPGTHAQAAGSNTADTAFYPELMCEKIARALYPMRVCQQVPCCPVVPLSVDPQHHREKEQDLKHVSALASEAIAAAVESDEIQSWHWRRGDRNYGPQRSHEWYPLEFQKENLVQKSTQQSPNFCHVPKCFQVLKLSKLLKLKPMG